MDILTKTFGKEVADIVAGQLEGYGYSYEEQNGVLVKTDLCSDEIWETTPENLLDDAIEYRETLLNEQYEGQYDEADEVVIEYRKMLSAR